VTQVATEVEPFAVGRISHHPERPEYHSNQRQNDQ
jgi:hypothetical protein